MYDSHSEDVIKALENEGYKIVSKKIANKGMKEIHSKNDIFAITARNEQG
jgi:predicted RNA binding protein YcfA (HicA-like mRNA interferase family)